MTQPKKAITILAGLENYLTKLQQASDDDFKKNCPDLWKRGEQAKFSYTQGRRWIKIIHSSGGIYAFIDHITGDIYAAATPNSPAKAILGNIFQEKIPFITGSKYGY